MAHWDTNNPNTTNSFSWAGQQTWPGNSSPFAQPVGPTDLLSRDGPRDEEFLIQNFNADLPDHNQLQDDGLDFSFNLAIGSASYDTSDIHFNAAKPASIHLDKGSSQASSTTGVDEDDSVVFSTTGDLYDTSFGDGIFNPIHSPAATSMPDAFLSTSPSFDDNRAFSKCPYLKVQTDNGMSGGTPAGLVPSVPHSSVASVYDNFEAVGLTATSTPRCIPKQTVSTVSSDLSSQDQYGVSHSPASDFFEQWGNNVEGEATDAFNMPLWGGSPPTKGSIPYVHDQLNPVLFISPAETPDVTMGHGDSATMEFPSLPAVHPIDYLSMDFTPRQGAEPRSLPNAKTLSKATTSTGSHLSVPPSTVRRRPSEPARLDGALGRKVSLSRLQPPPRGIDPAAQRRSPSQSPTSPSLSPIPSHGVLQRRHFPAVSRNTGSTMPVPIRSHHRRLDTAIMYPHDQRSPVRQVPRVGPPRGRRHGPMDPVSRGQAKETRNKKMVCIRCKQSKQKCKRSDEFTDGPCVGCEKHGSSPRWPGPCVKAHFEDLILAGTCNFISQSSISHVTLDGTRRIRRELPQEFPLEQVMGRLERVRRQFNFRIYQDNRPIYVLDLDSCSDYLANLKQQLDGTTHSLRTFIDKTVLQVDCKNEDWERCMTQVMTPRDDLLALLCILNNMPSRASFSYVSKLQRTPDGTPLEKLVDVEDPAQADNLVLAAQLSRIICRKLEVKAYAHLQRILHESGSMKDDDILPFLQRLGRILLTLRWRLSWWAVVLGPSSAGNNDNAGQRQFEHRVQSLCYVLYFYYCCVRRRLPAWNNVKALSGITSRYADTECEVWDDFPGPESTDGFAAWIQRGKELVVRAGVLRRLESMGLPA
ncbi:hypothetical protein CCHL11_02059 [Colletotrichum chlorophyti]|uniref:Uncharacterized protein n=1 Tax=Colletotrichum chlorophyti TaxID=708187 RepID=A0A1Q8S745_9PEZI|nr:hypothetical protein CCHL11_02059 [Colletotrichum chlorophyti]